MAIDPSGRFSPLIANDSGAITSVSPLLPLLVVGMIQNKTTIRSQPCHRNNDRIGSNDHIEYILDTVAVSKPCGDKSAHKTCRPTNEGFFFMKAYFFRRSTDRQPCIWEIIWGLFVIGADLQKQCECMFCIVDLHAVTVPQDPQALKNHIRETAAAYIAAGIDPDHCAIFPQSAVSGPC